MMQRSKQTAVLLVAGVVLVGAVTAFWAVRPSRNAPPNGNLPRLSADAPAVQTEPGRWRILASSRDAFVRDKERLNAQVTLQPVTGAERDSIAELRIVKLVPDSPLFAAGLRVGDVVREVNGSPVNSMSRAVNLANEIGSSPKVTAKIERAGRILMYDLVFE